MTRTHCSHTLLSNLLWKSTGTNEFALVFIPGHSLTWTTSRAASVLLEMDRWRVHWQPAHSTSGTNHHRVSLCWNAGRVSCPQGALQHSTQTAQHECNGEYWVITQLTLVICHHKTHFIQMTDRNKTTCLSTNSGLVKNNLNLPS